jgi:flavin reductase (DIM6/NTAB) family NADH-FMN oxidoreductase RutF
MDPEHRPRADSASAEAAGEVDAEELRRTMGHFATGVAVVTALDSGGGPVGTTVNTITSVSLNPPLVLVCLDLASSTLDALRSRGAFAINVLAADDQHLAAGFARRGPLKPWDVAGHQPGPAGAPRLAGALAHLECTVEHRLPGGDHEIVIGRVTAVETGEEDTQPLLFYRGTYSSLARR